MRWTKAPGRLRRRARGGPDHLGSRTVEPLPRHFHGLPAEADGETLPDILFDEAFYRRRYLDSGPPGVDARQHFDDRGRAEGKAPSLGAVYLTEAIRRRALTSSTPMADIVGLVPPESRELVRGGDLWERLWACAHPDLYAAQLGRDAADPCDADWAVADLLAEGARAGRRICALFNPQWYEQQLVDRARAVPDGVIPFFHWLTAGWDARIVPTPLFDEEFYRQQHPRLSGPWLFRQYLTRGCYRAQSRPSPVGRHHPGGDDPTAQQRRRPLLLREMMHRRHEFDLAQTSWLEEGCVAALRRYATLGSPLMQQLVMKAASIDPLVTATASHRRLVSCPPHRHPRLYLSEQVEALRVGLGQNTADTVILVPQLVPHPELPRALRLARAYRDAEPEGQVLLVGTDEREAPGREVDDAFPTVDLMAYAEGFGADQALAMLVDLVRGLCAERIVVIGSRRGQEMVATYGRQLSREAELGAWLLAGQPARQDGTTGDGGYEELGAVTDWFLVDDQEVRTALIERDALTGASRERLFAVDGLARPEGDLPLLARLADVSRRRA